MSLVNSVATCCAAGASDGDDVNVLTGDVITENARSNDVATRAEEPFQVGLVFGRIRIVIFFFTISRCFR